MGQWAVTEPPEMNMHIFEDYLRCHLLNERARKTVYIVSHPVLQEYKGESQKLNGYTVGHQLYATKYYKKVSKPCLHFADSEV